MSVPTDKNISVKEYNKMSNFKDWETGEITINAMGKK